VADEPKSNGNGGPPATTPAHGQHLFVRSQYRRVRPQAVRRLVAKVREVCPWLTEADVPLARSWSQLELLSDEVFCRLYRDGIVTEKGEPKALVNTLRQLRNTQIAIGNQLGLSPRARLEITRGDSASALDAVSKRIEEAVATDASDESA